MTDQTRQALLDLLAENPLWGVGEVCEALGTTTGNLPRWRGLPEPVMRVRATRLWFAEDIRDFIEAREARQAQAVA